jgi:hypothetical protein
MTDVTVMHDEFGRTLRPSESTSGPSNSQPSQPLSTHSSATLTDNHPRSREAPTTSLGAPFVDARTAASASASTSTPPTLHAGTVSADLNGSPVRHPPSAVHLASLNVSPGMMSEGLSVQYDDTSRSGPVGVATTIQKWRIHFGRPPNSATVAALAKPVTTGTLVQKLELDGEAVSFLSPLRCKPSKSNRANVAIFICRYVPLRGAGLSFFDRTFGSCSDRLATVYLRFPQDPSGFTLATRSVSLSYMTRYCSSPQKLPTS